MRYYFTIFFLFCHISSQAAIRPGGSEAESDSPLQRKISLNLSDLSLRQVLVEVAERTGVEFVYNDELLQAAGRFSARLKNKTAMEILEKLLEKSKIGFIVQSSSQIVLTQKSMIKRFYGALKGRVVHSISGDPLSDVNIEIPGTGYGTATDGGGFFTVRVPVGEQNLQASMIGFDIAMRHKVPVHPDKATYVTFRLRPKVIKLEEVKVVSTRERVPEQMQLDPSVRAIRRSGLIDIPTVGEPDLFRALQTMPGVSSPNDITNELFIRGGDSDQNLILLDGAVVYSPYHMFGLAGAFNPDLIEQVNLSLGGFSARYGDRLSSVIDVETRTGSPETVSGFGNLSLLSSKFTTISKLAPNLNFVFGARRTYHDVAARLFAGKRVPYYFYDLYSKLIFHPNAKDLLYFSTFFSRDQFKNKTVDRFPDIDAPSTVLRPGDGYTETNNDRIVWDNLIVTTHWLHEFSPGNHFEVQFSQSSSPSDFSLSQVFEAGFNATDDTRQLVQSISDQADFLQNVDTDVSIHDRTFRFDATLSRFKNQVWNFGAGYSFLRMDYAWQNLFTQFEQNELILFFDKAPANFDFKRRLKYGYLYIEHLWQVSDRLTLRPGLRLENRDYQNKAVVDPRVSLNYQVNSDIELKTAYGRFHQGLATSAQEGLFRFLPILFPTENDTPLESADHFIAGLRWDLNRWQVSVDSYYKKLHNILRAVNGRPDFEQAGGKAYGLEVGVKKLGDRLNFEMNYGLAFSKRNFHGHEYFNFSDQRHNFTMFGKYHLGKNWMLNFRWVLASGQPFTPTEVLFQKRVVDPLTGEWHLVDRIDSPAGDFSNRRNQVRYPVYHRLDLGLVKRIQKRGWAILPYVQVVNAYYRRNVLYYDWEFKNGQFERKTTPMLPIIPTFGVSFEF